MASILRQIVAGPRSRHPEANLDLCYITDNIIATSGPSSSYPSRAYRNPIEDLVRFLDYKHGSGWAIWEFRAEGAGYPDEAVYGRVSHFPWPDHHPPPFGLVPAILQGMKEWLMGAPPDSTAQELGTQGHRAVVVHCKAGKGRSGTMGCSYLLAEEGWTREAAMERFTARRMRPGFGNGITIPSQLRWLKYVERWRDHGKVYVEQRVEVTEVHVWGLRPGVKIAVEGYVEDGRKIETFHVFTKDERIDVDAAVRGSSSSSDNDKNKDTEQTSTSEASSSTTPPPAALSHTITASSTATTTPTTNTIFRPAQPILLPTNDINLACERRTRPSYGWTLVTSVAHVWFNTFFEGQGPELCDPARLHQDASSPAALAPASSGVFEIAWPAMDGIKGSSRKGKRAFDSVAVVWRVVEVVPAFAARKAAEAQAQAQAQAETSGAGADVGSDAGVRLHAGAGSGAGAAAADQARVSLVPTVNTAAVEETASGSSPVDSAASEEAMTGMAARLGLRRDMGGGGGGGESEATSRVQSDDEDEGSGGVESDVEVTKTHGIEEHTR